MEKFILPPFMDNSSVDDIHKRMLKSIPDDIDKGENGFLWDFTRPTAIEKSEMINFVLLQVLMSLFPKWSNNIILDYHGENRGIYRKEARHAVGTITVEGTKNTVIPKGSKFCTQSYMNEPSIEFETNEEAKIPESSSLDIDITAVCAGKSGNVAAETITLMSIPIKGIARVRNKEPTYYGYDQEDDKDLKERISDYDKHQGESFVGSTWDYKRWAESVPGVGNAKVISAKDDTGLVRIALTDSNGMAASEKLCEDVYNFIYKPDAPDLRLAPVEAHLKVTPPDIVSVSIKVNVEIDIERKIETLKGAVAYALTEYYKIACTEKEVKYSKIGAVLLSVEGINDYSNLLINDDIKNIAISDIQMPITTVEQVVLIT